MSKEMLKLKEALFGDYRDDAVKDCIQSKLKSIPVLSRYDDDVPFDMLEKVIWKLSKKYSIRMQYIMPNVQPEGHYYYSCSFKTAEDHKWLGTVNGITMYEVFAKGVLMCYSYAKKHDTDLH